jgi:hypothetical protein
MAPVILAITILRVMECVTWTRYALAGLVLFPKNV